MLGILDVGSNTFHLLIVKISRDHSTFDIVYKKRFFVYLSEDGLDFISDKAQRRSHLALEEIKSILDSHPLEELKAVATASLRSAKNARAFIDAVFEKFHIKIEIISGLREAELIAKGTLLLERDLEPSFLIMDIGGGSVELILVENRIVKSFVSLDMGISVLRKNFHFCDPLTFDEKHKIVSFINQKIESFKNKVSDTKPLKLIGASGAFEILEMYLNQTPCSSGNDLEIDKISSIIEGVIEMNLKERKQLKFMPDERADLSVESFLLMSTVLKAFKSIHSIIVSPFALKEGLIYEYLDMTK